MLYMYMYVLTKYFGAKLVLHYVPYVTCEICSQLCTSAPCAQVIKLFDLGPILGTSQWLVPAANDVTVLFRNEDSICYQLVMGCC